MEKQELNFINEKQKSFDNDKKSLIEVNPLDNKITQINIQSKEKSENPEEPSQDNYQELNDVKPLDNLNQIEPNNKQITIPDNIIDSSNNEKSKNNDSINQENKHKQSRNDKGLILSEYNLNHKKYKTVEVNSTNIAIFDFPSPREKQFQNIKRNSWCKTQKPDTEEPTLIKDESNKLISSIPDKTNYILNDGDMNIVNDQQINPTNQKVQDDKHTIGDNQIKEYKEPKLIQTTSDDILNDPLENKFLKDDNKDKEFITEINKYESDTIPQNEVVNKDDSYFNNNKPKEVQLDNNIVESIESKEENSLENENKISPDGQTQKIDELNDNQNEQSEIKEIKNEPNKFIHTKKEDVDKTERIDQDKEKDGMPKSNLEDIQYNKGENINNNQKCDINNNDNEDKIVDDYIKDSDIRNIK